jgi:hypothetical protein
MRRFIPLALTFRGSSRKASSAAAVAQAKSPRSKHCSAADNFAKSNEAVSFAGMVGGLTFVTEGAGDGAVARSASVEGGFDES